MGWEEIMWGLVPILINLYFNLHILENHWRSFKQRHCPSFDELSLGEWWGSLEEKKGQEGHIVFNRNYSVGMHTKNLNPRHPQYIGYIAVEQGNILSDNSWSEIPLGISEIPPQQSQSCLRFGIPLYLTPLKSFYFGSKSITLAMSRQGDEEKKSSRRKP